MEESICRVDPDLLERFTRAVLTSIGVPPDDAAVCADVIGTADRRGIDSHGVARLKTIYYDRIVHQRIQEALPELPGLTPCVQCLGQLFRRGHFSLVITFAGALVGSSQCRPLLVGPRPSIRDVQQHHDEPLAHLFR